MSEPQPSTIREGADIDDEHAPPLLPAASAEDRKAAAALSSLTTANDDETASKRSDADQKALGEAMSRLEVASGKGKAKEGAKGKAGEAEGVTKKKAIKVDQADVALLVSSGERYSYLRRPSAVG